jgi:hypothetical protein
MAWTTPRTWVAGEIPTAAQLNTHLRDNLTHLYEAQQHTLLSYTVPSTITLASSSDTGWQYPDATNIKLPFTKHGAAADSIVVFFAEAAVSPSSTLNSSGTYSIARFGFGVNAFIYRGYNGSQTMPNLTNTAINTEVPLSMMHIVTDLTPGNHTLFLVWRLVTNGASSMAIYTTDTLKLHVLELAVR